jgi:hypothetical protein
LIDARNDPKSVSTHPWERAQVSQHLEGEVSSNHVERPIDEESRFAFLNSYCVRKGIPENVPFSCTYCKPIPVNGEYVSNPHACGSQSQYSASRSEVKERRDAATPEDSLHVAQTANRSRMGAVAEYNRWIEQYGSRRRG